MRVSDLKRILGTGDEDAIVLVDGGPDHSYLRPRGAHLSYVEHNDGEFSEYVDDDNMSGGQKVVAFVVSVQ